MQVWGRCDHRHGREPPIQALSRRALDRTGECETRPFDEIQLVTGHLQRWTRDCLALPFDESCVHETRLGIPQHNALAIQHGRFLRYEG